MPILKLVIGYIGIVFLEAYLGTYSKEMPIASNDIFSAIIF
jgi:hypothetical protein